MKLLLRFFGLLDLVSFFLLYNQASAQILSFTTNTAITPVEFFSRLLFVCGWLSIMASSILLFIPRKAGIIVYYCQIPVRFIYFMFSFGFLSSLTYVTGWDPLVKLLFPVIVFGEFLRIYFSYRAYSTTN
ncbi:hypothetical protein [Pseudopedobacter beijingensis]|uniref:DUF4345 domain-containing protein n=1 Tax=Pseudopedobacter beijingensis TaxID=1207056 RepID=A0ABW4IDQ7_9SPHI